MVCRRPTGAGEGRLTLETGQCQIQGPTRQSGPSVLDPPSPTVVLAWALLAYKPPLVQQAINTASTVPRLDSEVTIALTATGWSYGSTTVDRCELCCPCLAVVMRRGGSALVVDCLFFVGFPSPRLQDA